jgi:hypothetical protein
MIVSLRLRRRVWWRLGIYLRTARKSIAMRWHCRERGRKSARSYRDMQRGPGRMQRWGCRQQGTANGDFESWFHAF